jgi:hypothetical protein
MDIPDISRLKYAFTGRLSENRYRKWNFLDALWQGEGLWLLLLVVQWLVKKR